MKIQHSRLPFNVHKSGTKSASSIRDLAKICAVNYGKFEEMAMRRNTFEIKVSRKM